VRGQTDARLSIVSFRLVLPRGRPAPVVVEVPHAGLRIPEVVAREIDCEPRDILRDADAYVDELFSGCNDSGATLLVADVSRYVVDLNREEDDVDALSVPELCTRPCRHGSNALCNHAPRGLIWRESTEGRNVLRAPLDLAAYERRMSAFYRPYHSALEQRAKELRAIFGYAIILSAHSMPAYGRGPDGTRTRRADVVPGTRGQSTAHPSLIALLDGHFRSAGLSVRHDDPYRGGATTARWGRVREGFHGMQVELNRALYMDETSLHRKRDGMQWLSRLCNELVLRLCNVDQREQLSP
jgi:N-formylglutamate deformylase